MNIIVSVTNNYGFKEAVMAKNNNSNKTENKNSTKDSNKTNNSSNKNTGAVDCK